MSKKKNSFETSLKEAIQNVKDDLGKEIIKSFGNKASVCIKGISTGLPGLDEILGTRGIVPGRIYELFGPESHGKTSLALTIVASFQKHEKICAYIDAEHALEPQYCDLNHVDCERLILAQPSSCEQA